jgi:hypothetical protein
MPPSPGSFQGFRRGFDFLSKLLGSAGSGQLGAAGFLGIENASFSASRPGVGSGARTMPYAPRSLGVFHFFRYSTASVLPNIVRACSTRSLIASRSAPSLAVVTTPPLRSD